LKGKKLQHLLPLIAGDSQIFVFEMALINSLQNKRFAHAIKNCRKLRFANSTRYVMDSFVITF
jgi:hypothetical protein